MTDIYTATLNMLEGAVPGTNVSAYVLTWDESKQQWELPDFPAVTYNYSGITPVGSHNAEDTNLYRIELTVEVWGDLEQIAANAQLVTQALNAKRVTAGEWTFTLVCKEARDVTELGLDFKRRALTFTGLAELDDAI